MTLSPTLMETQRVHHENSFAVLAQLSPATQKMKKSLKKTKLVDDVAEAKQELLIEAATDKENTGANQVSEDGASATKPGNPGDMLVQKHLHKTHQSLTNFESTMRDSEESVLMNRTTKEQSVESKKSATLPVLGDRQSQLKNQAEHDELESAPLFVLVTTYLGYLVLILFGHIRDFFGKRLKPQAYLHLRQCNGYAPLTSDFESFYTRRLYTRIRDCWNRPITGVPGRTLTLLERTSDDFNRTFRFLGTQKVILNLSSYNYLGFAQSEGLCADEVIRATNQYRVGSCSARMDLGTTDLHQEMEKLVARFLGKESAMVISMGFATNSTTLPALVEKGSLIVSDELNHSSLVFGSRLSGATIRIFKHNGMLNESHFHSILFTS